MGQFSKKWEDLQFSDNFIMEMQTGDYDDLLLRSRYYLSAADISTTPRRTKFSKNFFRFRLMTKATGYFIIVVLLQKLRTKKYEAFLSSFIFLKHNRSLQRNFRIQ